MGALKIVFVLSIDFIVAPISYICIVVKILVHSMFVSVLHEPRLTAERHFIVVQRAADGQVRAI